MQKISFLLIGLLIGSLVTYLITKNKSCNQDENLSAFWEKENGVPIEIASKRFAKYVERADKMYEDTANTRYLNFPFKDLEAIICRFKKEKGANGIRIYPMIYTKDVQGTELNDRLNLFNLLLVPIKSSNNKWNNTTEIRELIDTTGKENSFVFSYGDIENQIGQCPPPPNGSSICNNNGSLLLNYTQGIHATPLPDGRVVWNSKIE